MPSCCVSKCSSKTGVPFRKKVKYFCFPKDLRLTQKWLIACGKNQDYRVKFARVCAKHFAEDCFVLHKTKPRQSSACSKEVLKLKGDAVPSLFLTPPLKRKKDDDQIEENKRMKLCLKVPLCSVRTNILEDILTKSIPNYESDSFERKIEDLQNKNKQLRTEIEQLKVALNHSNHKLATMETNRRKDMKEYVNLILEQIFTKGQIKKLLTSNNNRVRWSSEDFINAFTLRSISSRAYQYLRDVQKIPLPCESTLNKWCSKQMTNTTLNPIQLFCSNVHNDVLT